MWAPDSKTIYFVSDQTDDVSNLYSMDLSGANKIQLTRHKVDGVRSASISLDGSVIAYEHGKDLWSCNTSTKKTKKLEIFH